jgi:hypothetical protein
MSNPAIAPPAEALLSCADFPTLCAISDWVGKNPWAGSLLAAALIALLIGLGFGLAARGQRTRDARLRAFVRSLGGRTRHDGGLVGEIDLGGPALVARSAWSGTQDQTPWTTGTVRVPDDGFTFSLGLRTGALTAGPCVLTGDGTFDALFFVSSNDDAAIIDLLDAPTRARLLRVVGATRALRTAFDLTRHDGTLFFQMPGHADGGAFDVRLRDAIEVVRVLARDGGD